MINPIMANSVANIYSKLGSSSSLLPIAVKDIANSCGLTTGSYITGKEVEGKDRLIDEVGTSLIWLGGIPFFKKVIDLSIYKIFGIDPKFDVRNLKNKDILKASIEKAPTEEIKNAIKKASSNSKLTKGLSLAKFGLATVGTIVAYDGLTKFRQTFRLNEAKKIIEAENNSKEPQAKQQPQNFGSKFAGKEIFFGGGLQDFMFNPVKNLMLVDAQITTQRLTKSQSKQEFINYAIKEGSMWTFLYFAGDMIKKHMEKKYLSKGTPIALDSRIIESQDLKDAFHNDSIKSSVEQFEQMISKDSSDLDIYKFIHDNPDNFIVKMAKKSDVVKTLPKSNQIDTRAFIDIEEFKGLKNSIKELLAQAPKENIDNYLQQVIKNKRLSVLKNLGTCIGVLGVAVPLLMIAMRYILPGNKEYKVMEMARNDSGDMVA